MYNVFVNLLLFKNRFCCLNVFDIHFLLYFLFDFLNKIKIKINCFFLYCFFSQIYFLPMYKSLSEGNGFHFIMSAYNLRGSCWWYICLHANKVYFWFLLCYWEQFGKMASGMTVHEKWRCITLNSTS